MPLKLVLIDDHELFRDGFKALLSAQNDFEVVGDAGNAPDAYTLVEEKHPDVVVMDVGLPGVNGLVATRELLQRDPTVRILLVSMHAKEEYAAQALYLGASGYALKDQAALEVVDAIRAVARGEVYLAPRLAHVQAKVVRAASARAQPTEDPLSELSPREREVFDLVVRGYSNEGVAGHLSISVKTVETHRAHINKKLQLHSTAELVRFAARHGLISYS